MKHAFSRDEFDDRCAQVRQKMVEADLDLLISANPANMCYLTGYDGWSFYTPQIVAIGQTADEPICMVRGIDQPGGRVTTYLNDENMIGYPDDLVQSPDAHPMAWMGAELARRGFDRGRIGVDTDAYYYSARAHMALTEALPNASFRDSGNLINWVRATKSDQEIAYMRDASRLVEAAMSAGIDAIEVGIRQCDAVAAIYDAQIRGTDAFGGEYTSIVPMLPTGLGTTTPHLTWSSEPFEVRQATILELAGCRNRYHCPMSRTVHLGSPPQRMADIATVAVDALNETISRMKPGMTCEDVQAVWKDFVTPHGIEKGSRMGYSIGLNYPPDWGEHTLSIRPGDKTELRPGMTIHVMPGIWLDTWGIEISEAVVVTETGADKLCDFPQHLVVKD